MKAITPNLPYPMDGCALADVDCAGIPDGFSSIARLVGHSPEECIFMNAIVVDRNHPLDRKATVGDDIDMRATQYVVALSGKGSYAAHFKQTPAHDAYVKKYLQEGTLIAISPIAEGRLYPAGSLICAVGAALSDPEIKDAFSEKKIINSFCLSDTQLLAAKVGGTVLNEPEAYLSFASKTFVHRYAREFNIPVASGLIISSANEIADAYNKLEENIKELGREPSETKIWIKPVTLSGGRGLIPLERLTPDLWDEAFLQVAQTYHKADFFRPGTPCPVKADFSECDYFMPIVVEIDACCMPRAKSVALNACVQATVGDKGITFVGNTLQITKNGGYMGSVMPSASQMPAVLEAQKAAQHLLNALRQKGYRGFAGIDVLVIENEDRTLQGYVLEANPRLNASTGLLRMCQYTSRESGAFRTGNSTDYHLPHGVEPLSFLKSIIGDDLFYRHAESGYKGFIPVMIDERPQEGSPVDVKGLIIEESLEAAAALQDRIKTVLASCKNN